MTTIAQITQRFAEQAGLPGARFLHSWQANVFVGGAHDRTLYSFGTHFPLAELHMPSGKRDKRSWWLLNGDRYSPSTTEHQRITRDAVKATGLRSLIVPFSALREAGIDRNSVVPVEIEEERYEQIERTASSRMDVPEGYRYARDGLDSAPEGSMRDYYAWLGDDGLWHWLQWRHWLGASVFRAKFSYTDREHTDRNGMRDYPVIKGQAYFLSAFDEQEGNMYFLCQMPKGSRPKTVAEALEALKPQEVKDAETVAGLKVLRQGDVFAIPMPFSTRQVKLGGRHERSAYVLEVNHIATDVVYKIAATYARGFLRHKPREYGRRPEHRMMKLGDGKTWYRVVKNTVPMGRAWSLGGKVD